MFFIKKYQNLFWNVFEIIWECVNPVGLPVTPSGMFFCRNNSPVIFGSGGEGGESDGMHRRGKKAKSVAAATKKRLFMEIIRTFLWGKVYRDRTIFVSWQSEKTNCPLCRLWHEGHKEVNVLVVVLVPWWLSKLYCMSSSTTFFWTVVL